MARVIVAIVLLLLPTAGYAQAEKRFALLIGNQAYGAKIGALKNPHADIALVAEALRSLAFKVTEIKDADYRRSTSGLSGTSKPYVARVKAPSASCTIPATEPPIQTPRSII